MGQPMELATKPPSKKTERAWVFTLNNYTDDDILRLQSLEPKVKRMIVGREVAPTTGTPHLQGYIRFAEPVRFSWWKNQFPRAHVEVRHPKATDSQNAAYCSKAGQVAIDYGQDDDTPREAYPRTDRQATAAAVCQMIEEGASWRDIERAYPAFTFFNHAHIHKKRKREAAYKNGDLNPDWIEDGQRYASSSS